MLMLVLVLALSRPFVLMRSVTTESFPFVSLLLSLSSHLKSFYIAYYVCLDVCRWVGLSVGLFYVDFWGLLVNKGI